jgi:hypothetical protein
MADTLANILDLTKEVWTQDRLEKVFYNENRFLDKIEKTNKYSIGRKALVPLELQLPGGYSAVPTAGSAGLNAADALHVDTAEYTLTNHWQQVAIEAAAMGQADSVGVRSTVDQVNQTVESNLAALRREINRQVVGNGDALIAKCTTTTSSNTILLDPTGYGYDAIVRGWLRVGQTVDIGTTAAEGTIAADVVITAVSESSTAPSITVSGSAVSTTTSHYISIANARLATASYESSGLRTIAGSASSTIGTLAPASVNQWKPASVDTSTTLVSLDLLLNLQKAVYQKTGKWPKYVTTSPKQCANLYSLFQNQVRFNGDNPSAGNVESFTWNGMEIVCDPDIPDRELYMLTTDNFFVVTDGKFGKPTWASAITGSGSPLEWKQGTTQFVDALYYPFQLAINRRDSHASAIGLTA